MKKVMRPRFYCDFCNKGGGSGGHIKKHESRCTLNPNRECGMCNLRHHEQPDLRALISILPDPEELKSIDVSEDGLHAWTTWRDIPPETVARLRDASGDCPACIMAALRQRGLPVASAGGFNFTEECKAVWAEFNRNQMNEHAYEY